MLRPLTVSLYLRCAMKDNRNAANSRGEPSNERRGNDESCEIDSHVSKTVTHMMADTSCARLLSFTYSETCESNQRRNMLLPGEENTIPRCVFIFISVV
jgi:hypothetical protein